MLASVRTVFLTRRHFLVLSAATATSAIAGCRGSASSAGSTAVEPQLVSLFSSNRVIAAGIPQRLPFGVVNNGLVLPDSASLPVRVLSGSRVIDELDVPEAGGVAQPLHLGGLRRSHVDAHSPSSRADLHRGAEQVRARAAAEIDHHLPLAQCSEIEVMPDPANEAMASAGIRSSSPGS